jgi:hypothetical protein
LPEESDRAHEHQGARAKAAEQRSVREETNAIVRDDRQSGEEENGFLHYCVGRDERAGRGEKRGRRNAEETVEAEQKRSADRKKEQNGRRGG